MDLVIIFFTYLPLHFWDAVNQLILNPSDIGLLAATIIYGLLTIVQYVYLYSLVADIFNRIFY